MKTKNMYLNRLLKLARHIGIEHMRAMLFKKGKKYSATRGGCGIDHFYWALEHLVQIAPKQWFIGADGFVALTVEEKLNALTGAAVYFNLSGDELFSLFVPGYHSPIYLGKALGDNATPDELANNIYQFVLYKEAENAGKTIPVRTKNSTEKKVIKKLKFKNAA
ncbi:MAG: hypothetical protein K8R85_07160 [Bacteroidetes bacterium]|nr:hypothetical protein [Bacteroidota bacterium]